jgi:hypothetical protein
MIPPKEYAELVGAKYQTVMLWLRQELIPGAQRFDLPAGGHYYVIPENAPKPATRRGPKPKKTAQAASAAPTTRRATKKEAAK